MKVNAIVLGLFVALARAAPIIQEREPADGPVANVDGLQWPPFPHPHPPFPWPRPWPPKAMDQPVKPSQEDDGEPESDSGRYFVRSLKLRQDNEEPPSEDGGRYGRPVDPSQDDEGTGELPPGSRYGNY
ncbi:hypothetical protein BDV59DRAFT_198987 [Aspergillus ambiguus]|uniref:uncharacterized protein n=1 Tax=Aspergillus ambiguus TaxID=176160 RepID=UPI003CCE4706